MKTVETIIHNVVQNILSEAKLSNGMFISSSAKGQFISNQTVANIQIPIILTMNDHSAKRIHQRNVDEETINQLIYSAIPQITQKFNQGLILQDSSFNIIDKQSCTLIACTMNVHSNLTLQINIKTVYPINAKSSKSAINKSLSLKCNIVINNDNPSQEWIFAMDNMLDNKPYQEYKKYMDSHDSEHQIKNNKQKRTEIENMYKQHDEHPYVDYFDGSLWDDQERNNEQSRLDNIANDNDTINRYGNTQKFLHNKGAGQREFFHGNTTADQLKNAQNQASWNDFDLNKMRKPSDDEISKMINTNNRHISNQKLSPKTNPKSRKYINDIWKTHDYVNRKNNPKPSQDEEEMLRSLGF